MAVHYCEYCDQYVDLDTDVEHFPDQYWEAVGADHGKCQIELEDDEWIKQARYGDAMNKRQKEQPSIKRTDPDTGRDI